MRQIFAVTNPSTISVVTLRFAVDPHNHMDARSFSATVTGAWWRRLQQLRRRDRRPAVALSPVGLGLQDQQALRQIFEKLGAQLELRFDFDDSAAQVVLLDVDYAGRTPPQLVKAMTRGRPAILVERCAGLDAGGREALRQELLRQLAALPALRRHPAQPGPPAPVFPPVDAPPRSLDGVFDSDFDSVLQAEQLRGEPLAQGQRTLIDRVLQGLHDDGSPALRATYGPAAALHFDFAARLVALDPLALQGLRVRGDLPRPTDAPTLTDQAVTHDLDEVVWHLGIACGRFALLGQPDDAWHADLVGVDAARIEHFTRQPRHLELMRRLQQGPASPSALRRHVRIGVADLRCFLQACLFLGLLRWDDRRGSPGGIQNLV